MVHVLHQMPAKWRHPTASRWAKKKKTGAKNGHFCPFCPSKLRQTTITYNLVYNQIGSWPSKSWHSIKECIHVLQVGCCEQMGVGSMVVLEYSQQA
jgi:hypothetical protein